MEFSRPEYWSGYPFPSPRDLPNPGMESRSPTLQADSLPAEPPGEPKNTAEGSPSLLQQIFLTQESNWGLLHCRWILYHLSQSEEKFQIPHLLSHLIPDSHCVLLTISQNMCLFHLFSSLTLLPWYLS